MQRSGQHTSRMSQPPGVNFRALQGHRPLGTVICGLLLATLAAGCPEPATNSPPVATSRPAEASVAEPPPSPATQPARPVPSQRNNFVELRINHLNDPQDGWLRIEAMREGAPGAWATGHFILDRKIEIETEHVDQFSIDVSRLRINWNRRVILKIDGRASQLSRKKSPVVHFKRDRTGAWNVVKK